MYRKRFTQKARIHATNQRFKILQEKSLELLEGSAETTILSVMQIIQKIPPAPSYLHYKKGKLNFEKVYEDMLKILFNKLQLHQYKKVIINIDDRKMKTGRIGKYNFQTNILTYLNRSYPFTKFDFRTVPSTENILIEIADFISNNLYKSYVGQKIDILDRLKDKIVVIKNPLGKPRG